MLDYKFLTNPYPDNPDPVSGDYAPQSLQEHHAEKAAKLAAKQQDDAIKMQATMLESILK